MKVIDIHKNITRDDLLALLIQKLNPRFQLQTQSDICFELTVAHDFAEIAQAHIYEPYLFRIKLNGTELSIIRFEHYLDDVNPLTLESVLNTLFEELSADGLVTLVLEG